MTLRRAVTRGLGAVARVVPAPGVRLALRAWALGVAQHAIPRARYASSSAPTTTSTAASTTRRSPTTAKQRLMAYHDFYVPQFLDPTHEVEYTEETFAAELDAAGLRANDVTIRWGEIWAVARVA